MNFVQLLIVLAIPRVEVGGLVAPDESLGCVYHGRRHLLQKVHQGILNLRVQVVVGNLKVVTHFYSNFKF